MLLTLFRCGKNLKYPFGRRLGGFYCLSGCTGKYLFLKGTQTWPFNNEPTHYNEQATGNYWTTATFTNDKEQNAIKNNQYCLLRRLLYMCRSCAHTVILIPKSSAGPYCLELMEQSDPVYSKPSGTVSIAAENFNFPFHFHDITWPDSCTQKYETTFKRNHGSMSLASFKKNGNCTKCMFQTFNLCSAWAR